MQSNKSDISFDNIAKDIINTNKFKNKRDYQELFKKAKLFVSEISDFSINLNNFSKNSTSSAIISVTYFFVPSCAS